MFETIIASAFTAIAGAIASIWSYWTGRKKTASENAIKRSEALDKMNEIIDKQAGKLEQLYEVVTGLRSENAKLILQNDTLKNSVEQLNKEVEALRKELSIYKKLPKEPAAPKEPTDAKKPTARKRAAAPRKTTPNT